MGGEGTTFDGWCVPAWRGRRPLDAGSADALADTLSGRREALLDRPVGGIARTLGRAGARLGEEGDPLRRRALEALPGTTGLSPEMCRLVLDGMARDWTGNRLLRLLRADFPDPEALDGFVPGPAGSDLRAVGASFALHVSAGSVPGVSATSLLRSLLVKTPVLVKPGRGDVVLPALLLQALAEEDPDLAGAAAVVYWPGGDEAFRAFEDTLLARAELVVVYGGDPTVRDLRGRLGPTTRVVGYHHRVSFAVVGRAATRPARLEESARSAARAAAVFDGGGCVSPRAFFVEGDADAFAEALARALGRLHDELPAGRLDDAEASSVHQLRGTVAMREAAGEPVRLLAGEEGTWTVVVERNGVLGATCPGRAVRVVPVEDVTEVPDRVRHLGRHLQSAGVVGLADDPRRSLAEALARVGVLRVAPLEEMAFPPAWWRHDGRGPLRELVRWVEVEGSGEGEGG